MPNRANLEPRLPSSNQDDDDFYCFDPEPIFISGILSKFEVMSSKEMPKKINFIGSNDELFPFIVKKDEQGDMRKEARFIDYAKMVNTLIESNTECKIKNLNCTRMKSSPCLTTQASWNG